MTFPTDPREAFELGMAFALRMDRSIEGPRVTLADLLADPNLSILMAWHELVNPATVDDDLLTAEQWMALRQLRQLGTKEARQRAGKLRATLAELADRIERRGPLTPAEAVLVGSLLRGYALPDRQRQPRGQRRQFNRVAAAWEYLRAKEAGAPVSQEALAAKHGVSARAIQAALREIEPILSALVGAESCATRS